VKNFINFLIITIFFLGSVNLHSAEKIEYLKTDWSFKGLFGKFDRSSLQRGYQVYTEVCSSCHSMKYVSYRNLSEKGGPEFSEGAVKAIAASFEVNDGPNADGEMFVRPGKPSDKFVMPYDNVKAAEAANGGAYPPDMSVLVKARSGGVDYIYSLLQGYEDVPNGMTLDEGVHYNKYIYENKIKMSAPLSEDIVEYGDGTKATVEQMSKDVTTFLMWAAEPHLESRHQMGFKAIVYLIILTILVYFSMKKIWSRVETEV
jgi:ubiquinol-cytochrome c reductase cytochrome c1 subunit